jgi:hypothetical protein
MVNVPMYGKLKLEVQYPMTQSIESGKALAKFLGLKEEMPKIIPLAKGSQLTLSSKRDAYYFTTLQSCTCPAGEHHKICYHRRDLCQATMESRIPKEMLVDAYAFNPTEGEISYWQEKEKGSLELLDNVGFRPVLAGE